MRRRWRVLSIDWRDGSYASPRFDGIVRRGLATLRVGLLTLHGHGHAADCITDARPFSEGSHGADTQSAMSPEL
jgi:hypothetical protein